jgi:hypothetical protein
MVRDMKAPVWRGRGLCEQHCRQWDRRDPKIGFHMVDEMYAHPELDKEYEEAVAIGDTKNGGVERKRLNVEKI